ncbi:uncharacterized protein LOC106357557 isoform X5 [Brassica napus]|uniref:uncharacterized protein LOC106357557 isoform X5 n=1 Tax=Brassica napus TaxID=3708 RepID=UPI000BBEE896|nr:uncharacterized protein LOC106357557 isoform X5 [Brassica napus]
MLNEMKNNCTNQETSAAAAGGKKKRRREEEEEVGCSHAANEDECFSLQDELTFSDTSVALRMMRSQFPRIDQASVPPFILQSQLYSSVNDRTQVDRELERLRRDKVVRVFKLNTGQDDHAIIFLDDYLNQVDRIAKRMEEKKQSDTDIFKWFKEHVLDSKLEPSIAHHELGRKELLSLLKRKRHKEMFLAELEKKRLRYSPLDMRFHIRDLIGSGHLKTFQTTSGLVVRVSTD